jgi:hypothetical protein
MVSPDGRGFVRPTGRMVGGHAIVMNGVDVRRGVATLRNSWGAGWGRGGNCYLSFGDLGWLLDRDGEACIPISRKRPTNLGGPS